MLHNKIRYSLGSHIVLILAAASMAACGSQSSAAPNKAQSKKAASSPASTQANSAPRTTPATTTLPIAQGIYGDVEAGGCAKTSRIFFYGGADYGLIHQADPDAGTPASMHVFRIQRVGTFTPGELAPSDNIRDFRGLTKIWSNELGSLDTYGEIEIEYVGIGATATGGMIRRVGGTLVGIGKYTRADESYQKCAFSQLSPRMQAAIRAKRPQLAVGAATGDAVAATRPAAAAAPAPVAPFNIRPGHYVPVAAPCNSTSEMIYYYDGRRRGWIDNGPFNPNQMDPVAGVRRRGADWLTDPDMGETLRVQAPDRIEIGDPNTGTEVMRWCPANAVRASARAR